MSESGDYDPGHWKGHDFGTARKTYDKHVGRSYSDAVSKGKRLEELVPESLTTNSPAPLVIACDITGSMGEWPATIFSKLPYLELEGQEYLGEDMEISWAATGDAYWDKYPLQARPFTKGVELKKRLEELVIEGGGGGGGEETYELTALYYARNVTMPQAIRPILIFIGDEAPYDFVNSDQVKKYAYGGLEDRLNTLDLFRELRNKYSVYLIRKPYGRSSGNSMSPMDQKIYEKWAELLGHNNIAHLPEAGRVVDVIFGILARETGRVKYFREELEDRQKPEQVNTVFKSLETIHAISGKDESALPSGKSTMHLPDDDSTDSEPLL